MQRQARRHGNRPATTAKAAQPCAPRRASRGCGPRQGPGTTPARPSHRFRLVHRRLRHAHPQGGENMAWSPNSSRTPRRRSCGRNSSGGAPVLRSSSAQPVPQWDCSRPAEQGEAGQGGPRIREHPAHYGNRVVGQQGVGVQHEACIGAVASCTPRLIAAARPEARVRQREHALGEETLDALGTFLGEGNTFSHPVCRAAIGLPVCGLMIDRQICRSVIPAPP